MIGLDKKDRLLLEALKTNARSSLAALARKIHLSRSATHQRVNKLEAHGVIKRYTIEVDQRVVPATRAFLTLKIASDAAQKVIAPLIHDLDGVEAAYCLAGDIDMFVYCVCDNIDELADLRNRLASLDGVQSITTRQVLASSIS